VDAPERNDAANHGRNLSPRAPANGCPLTECVAARLRPLLKPISSGQSNQEIAEELCLAVHTVENYVSQLISEFGCSNRVRLAIQLGICATFHESEELAP